MSKKESVILIWHFLNIVLESVLRLCVFNIDSFEGRTCQLYGMDFIGYKITHKKQTNKQLHMTHYIFLKLVTTEFWQVAGTCDRAFIMKWPKYVSGVF